METSTMTTLDQWSLFRKMQLLQTLGTLYTSQALSPEQQNPLEVLVLTLGQTLVQEALKTK